MSEPRWTKPTYDFLGDLIGTVGDVDFYRDCFDASEAVAVYEKLLVGRVRYEADGICVMLYGLADGMLSDRQQAAVEMMARLTLTQAEEEPDEYEDPYWSATDEDDCDSTNPDD